jgi:hypothetical protein
MANLGTITVSWKDQTYELPMRTIYTVLLELEVGKNVTDELGPASLAYAMAWVALKQKGVDVPSTWQDFVKDEPDVDFDEPEDVGKDGAGASSI